MHRTTVILQDEVYREVKRKAIDRGRPMRALVEEALRAYLGLARKRGNPRHPRFGVYRFRVKGDLRRETIYGDRA
jgi:metal-responsive CopG/Arc/MetJ family transcriptional regulator